MASATPEQPVPQAAAVPYRWRGDAPEFCLITSTQKAHWAFPKGMIDPGESWSETALKEAYEEAGLRGAIEGPPLGVYAYVKWGQELEVTVGLLRVDEELEAWEEAGVRSRRWAVEAEALTLIDRAELRQLLAVAAARLRSEGAGERASG
jgi:8-oxo-dGTP pyrophosphatase MutT (NUDIX family)